MPKVLANDINIHYQRVGTGPDVVMLHGLTGNLAVWHLKMVPLFRRDYTVTTVDLRGHGYTDMPPTGYDTDTMAEDLKGLLDVLEIDKAYFVGHSYGADTLLSFAVRYPQRINKMVTIEATVPALIHLRDRDDWEGWRYWSETLEDFGIPVPPEKRTDIDYMIPVAGSHQAHPHADHGHVRRRFSLPGHVQVPGRESPQSRNGIAAAHALGRPFWPSGAAGVADRDHQWFLQGRAPVGSAWHSGPYGDGALSASN
jgi:pimeloyl-ACP methyl ester carboxylesterase